MKTSIILALSAISFLALAGCNKAESPAKVDSDVTKAAESAAEKDIKADEKQAGVEAGVNKDLASAEQTADAKTADAAADAAVTHAEGINKVTVEKCEALSGDLQQACKDKAAATLDLAKANAKAMKAAHN
ncbi:MAG: hypothetical protein WDO56_20125 [Gammaproteobacteria bacterium]